MAEAIVMPDLGAGMGEGTLINWTRAVGDTIRAGDVIAEIEADKTTVEVPSPIGGTIGQLIGEAGIVLKAGAVIGFMAEAGGSAAPAPAAAAPAANGNAAPAAPPQAAPAAAGEATIPYGGSEKDAVPQNAAPGSAAPGSGVDIQPAQAEADPDLPDGVRASPIARRLAEERGIDIRRVTGSGPNGRIVKADVEGYQPAAAQSAPAAPAGQPAPDAPPAAAQVTNTNPQAAPSLAPVFGPLPTGPDVEIIDTSKMRGRIAARMIESKQQIPHFYVVSEIDVDALLALRKQVNENLDDESKVSVNDLIVKALAVTLRQFPNLNSHYYGDKIVRHKRINIGIAVALPNGGLINVVSKDADRTPLSQMARAHKEMFARAREGKVKPDDVQGSTFTVSNLGGYDVDQFTAIISPPEAGILAVGTAKKIPVVLPDGSIGIGNRMKITLSADHRASDGAEGAQFMQSLKRVLEKPMLLLV
jgi:pyruvate dehydrogenase E2 component (dihydrolipoamide acetyltransferase)